MIKEKVMSEELRNLLKMVELIKDEDVRQDVLLYLLEKNKTNVNKRYLKILEMKFRNRHKYRKYEVLDIDISINIPAYTQIEEGELRSLMIEYFGKDFFEYEETGRMPSKLIMRIRRKINRYRKIFKDWI